MTLDYAINLAKLWRSGKLIGCDPYKVCEILLKEIERLRKENEKV